MMNLHRLTLGGKTRRPAGRGFTLIEMLVVITLTSLMLGMMLVLAAGIMRRISHADMHLARSRNVQEAAEQLRGLLHGAEACEVEPAGLAVSITTGGNNSKKARLQLADKPFRLELTTAGEPRKRIFGLTGLERGRFSMAQVTGGRPVAVLELWPDGAAERRLGMATPAQPLRIESAIGGPAGREAKGAKP